MLKLVLLFLTVLTANTQDDPGAQLRIDRRIMCFTLIYFQSGNDFDEYLDNQETLKEKRRMTLERKLVDQIEVCEEQLMGYKTSETLNTIFSDQAKLMEMITALRKVKQEHAMGNVPLTLSQKQQQIVRDFGSYSVMFEELKLRKNGNAEKVGQSQPKVPQQQL